MDPRTLHAVPDHELLRRLVELVSQSRRVDADLVSHVGEVEARRLYAREASPSMFAYCVERLHLSEGEAYACIRVARAARRHPVLLEMLRDGRLHLSGLVRLVPHLTVENREWLLERAVHRSKRQIEELVAELFPRPDAPTVIRRLPVRWPGRPAAAGLDPGAPIADPGPAPPPQAGSLLQHPDAAGLQPPDGADLGRATDSASLLRPSDGAGIRQPVDGRGRTHADGGARLLCPGTVDETGSVAAPAVAPADPGPAALLPPGETRGEPGRRSVGDSSASAVAATLVALAPPRAVVEPLSAARYRVQFTASAELRRKLERLQALMRCEVPDGDLAAIIDRAVSEKLERLEARRYAKTRTPWRRITQRDASAASRRQASVRVSGVSRGSAVPTVSAVPAASSAATPTVATSSPSRHIPAAVRRTVLERDGSRCGFVDAQGRRCSEQDRLEFHHRQPFAMGGDHGPGNVGLLCRTHNLLLAETDYGAKAVRKHLAAGGSTLAAGERSDGRRGGPPGLHLRRSLV